MKILMVITSHDKLGDTGRKTGFWLEELAAPYYAFKDAGVAKVREFADQSRGSDGNLRFDVLTQASRPNHLTVVESWSNAAAKEANVSSSLARTFRQSLMPMSGSLYDGMVRLWDVTTGEELRRFQGHGDFVFNLAFAADGRRAGSRASACNTSGIIGAGMVTRSGCPLMMRKKIVSNDPEPNGGRPVAAKARVAAQECTSAAGPLGLPSMTSALRRRLKI